MFFYREGVQFRLMKVMIGVLVFFVFCFFGAYEFYGVPIVPESERRLASILLAIDSTAKSRDNEFQKILKNLISKFPNNTEIKILGPSELVYDFMKTVRNRTLEPLPVSSSNFWTQDMFEVLNRTTLLVPDASFDVFNPKVSFSVLRKIKKNVVKTPFYFEGGNLTIARLPNQKLAVFMGYGVIEKTAQQWQDDNPNKSMIELKQQARRVIEDFFSHYGLSIVVLGDQLESPHLVHIDQGVLFIDKNTVFVADYQGRDFAEVEVQLQKYQMTLENLGYNLKRVAYSDVDLASQKYRLNAIVFSNGAFRDRYKKTVIFPVFEGEYRFVNSEIILEPRVQKFTEQLKNLDIEAVSVVDSLFYKFNGSFHCLSNVLE